MKASIIESPRHISIVNAPVPVAGAGEVLVRVSGTGLCISNLPLWEGREWFNYPCEPGAPGHEGYGTVEHAGQEVDGLSAGDAVTFISYNAYAEFDKAHFSNVIKIPPSLQGNPFPGEPLACAVNIFNRSDIRKEDTVVVIGAGFIGCLLIQLAAGRGAEVVAVSRRDSSLEFAALSGANHLVRFESIYETSRRIEKVATAGITRVIEATGHQSSLDLATCIVSEGGRLIIAGYHQDGTRTINMQLWNWKGIDVINAHERDPRIYVEGLKIAIQKVLDGELDINRLITHRFKLEEINHAFRILHDKPEGFLKGLITIG